MTSPESKVAVVTGANRGLGLEIVRQLAQHGMRVVLASRDVERGHQAWAQLGELADRVTVRQLDVADADSVTRFIHWLHGRFHRCDVLINNAAIAMDLNQVAATADLGVVRQTLETNLFGAWQVTQAVVPAMCAQRYGRIVNISSGAGKLATMGSGLPAYRVSKCALNAVTRILAQELCDLGILVNSCCPGSVRTRMGGPSARTEPAEAARTPVWLATLPPDGPTGGFFRDGRPLDW